MITGLRLQKIWGIKKMCNVKKEEELYKPMSIWLKQYVEDKYKSYRVISLDTHSEKLDSVLSKQGIVINQAIGIDIKIDVLAIAKKRNKTKLFFIEAKKNPLTLKDLGQLWAYCKLIDPEEAFLMSSGGIGSLNKVLKTYLREDLLDFGKDEKIKKMTVAKWDIKSDSPDMINKIPK